MTPENWQRIKQVLEAVEGVDGAARDLVLENACEGNAELRAEVESLLEHEARIGVFEAAAAQPGRACAEPSQIGPYRIERLLGSGGMGDVYLASRADEQYRKQVAIKIIQRFGSENLERRFRNERQILAMLEHPSIARLLDGGTLPDGRLYFVMEYIEGEPIDAWVDGRKPPLADVLRLFLQVCAAVQFAHQNLVVHRDLKPGNILVNEAGEPRLLDFGIAKMLPVEAVDLDRTAPLERLLTPSYASPEQVTGAPLTTATDVYSLGVLLYRLLTGVSPYKGAPGFPVDVAGAILRYEPPPASAAAADAVRVRWLRGDLDAVLRKAMEKDAARRYATVEAFAEDVRRYLEGRPVLARRGSAAYRARKFVRRNRLAVAAAAVVATAIAAGTGSTLWYARRAQAEKARADQRFDELRRISESLLFEFHDSIQNLPGATDARALVLRRALEYLDRLAAEDGSDPAVQRDLATAYARVGGILGGERHPHLGGAASLNKSLESYQKALAIRRKLFLGAPKDAQLREDYIGALGLVAGAYDQAGRPDDAIALYKERLPVIEAVPPAARPADMRYSYATTFASMSDVYRNSGDLPRALETSRRALELRKALLAADPGSPRAQRVVALSHEFVGYALMASQRYGEAAREHTEAAEIFTHLVEGDPHNTDLQRNRYVAEENLCESMARAGDARQAEPHCRLAIHLTEALQANDADNVQTAEDVGSAYGTMGFVLHRAGRLAEAREWEAKAVARYRDNALRDPDSPDAANGYAEAMLELAEIERDLHSGAECAHLRQAAELVARAAAMAPRDRGLPDALAKARAATACRPGPAPRYR